MKVRKEGRMYRRMKEKRSEGTKEVQKEERNKHSKYEINNSDIKE